MRTSNQQLQGQAGVAAVGRAVLSELRWIWREQPTLDTGIDAIIETVENDTATGRLLGVQVKSGVSYVKERSHRGVTYRGDLRHRNYWLKHALPVIVVVHDPDTDTIYWQQVRAGTVERKATGFTMVLPLAHRLDASSRESLSTLTTSADDVPHRLRMLQLDRPWMELLEQGRRIIVELDEWINKSSGRASLRLIVEDERGEPTETHEWHFLPGATSYDVALRQLLPWADLHIDDDLYESHDEDLYELETGSWDAEDGKYITDGDFAGWRQARFKGGLRPYGEFPQVRSTTGGSNWT